MPQGMDCFRHIYIHDQKHCLSTYHVPGSTGGAEEIRKLDGQNPSPHGAYIQVTGEQTSNKK